MTPTTATYEIVVARYNENIEWLRSEIDHCIFFNKGDHMEDIQNQIILKNVGRESDSYLHYIIEHYNHLPDVVVFTQANIADHKGSNNVQYLLGIKDQALRHGMSQNAYIHHDVNNNVHFGPAWNVRPDGFYLKDNYKNNTPIVFKTWFENTMGIPYPNPIVLYCNAIFAIRKDHIRKRPLVFYERLLQEVNHHINPAEGHFLERAWFYIFASFLHFHK